MFLWKSSFGYVIIKVVCCRAEAFINELLLSGVSVHNVEKHGRSEVICTLRTMDLDAVRSICAEKDMPLEIIRRGGLPVFIACMKARPALIAFIAAAVCAMILLSQRVLAIEISGGDGRLTADVSSVLQSEAIEIGSPLASIDAHALETKIVLSDPDIAAAAVKRDGTILKIKLIRSVPEIPETDDRPCSIYADKDCVIRKITATDGTELVCAGDAVKKDQLLVSGDITPEGAEAPRFVHAKAEIIGEVAYRFTVTVGRTALELKRSGRTETIIGISLFGKRFVCDPGFEQFETEFEKSTTLDASLLPIRISSGTAYELVLMNTELNDEEMLIEATRLADERLLLMIPTEARIIAKTTEQVRNGDGSLSLIVAVHTIEKIGYLRYL